MKLSIIFEDEHLIAVNKPAGLLTVPDRYDTSSQNLTTLMKNKYGTIFTVHRLDRDTSGLIVFAKTEESHRTLSLAFEGRSVEKHYLAIVTGTPPEEGTIDEPIAHSLTKPGTMTVAKKGKASVTNFKVIEKYALFSLLDVHIETGRTHQIRVHMAYIGHPLFIDEVYGTRSSFKVSELKGRKYHISKHEEEERPLISRQTLHSHKLVFKHPITGETLNLECPLPKDMRALISQAEKWTK
ncbi:MAG TPA: RluA family pseudouridine synthase [Saprospiraceae bacterium]|nr:RluA family pseudouridine synthase [Saprospiraceae bacterium]